MQENGAATIVQGGKIFTCPKTFFTWVGFGFSLYDDDKEEDDEEEEEEKEQEEEDQEEHRKGKIYLLKTFTPRTFYSQLLCAILVLVLALS